MKRICLILAGMVLSITAFAQNILDFEDKCYKSIGIYDSWVDSPFRTGIFEGNCAVIENHLKDESNPSDMILAVQRSRFGSNTFGVRVDLVEPFDLPTRHKDIEFLINRPYPGRVMVIGLGRRSDRPWQSPETEQFTLISKSDVPADSWHKVTIPVKGAPGVKIYSLIIVPDCESPHDYTEDKVCYIDNIIY